MPMTEHSAQILTGSWPSQSVMAWAGYSMQFKAAANSLFQQLNTQYDIKDILAPMEGAFIDAARNLAMGRETALQNRIEGYTHISEKAKWAANELQATKSDLVEIVKKAEEDIQAARDAAEKAKAAAQAFPLTAGAAIAAIEGQLQGSIAGIVATAKAEAQARDLQGAGTVTALSNEISQWAPPFANSPLPEFGGMPGLDLPEAPPAPPAQPQAQPVDFMTGGLTDSSKLQEAQQNTGEPTQQQATQNNIQQTAMRTDRDPAKEAAAQPTKPSTPASPPAASSPSSPSTGGDGSNPGSVLGKMMEGGSSSSSSSGASSSSSPMSSSSGSSNPAGAQSSQLANPNANAAGAGNAASAGAGGGAGGANAAANAAGRAPGLASLGSGLAESTARMGSGAINTAANAIGNAANVGTNVAQNVAQAAGAAPPVAPNPAASTMPAAAAPPAGGAPMAMMPPGGGMGGGGPVSPVTGGPPAAGPSVGGGTPTTPAAGPVASGAGPSLTGAAGGPSIAPVPMQGSPIRGIGADGATGDILFDQAMDAGRDVISALVAQTLSNGYIDIHYAVSLIWERGGTVSAWLATSEGASYIPRGVGIPQDVRLAIADPVVGNELWNATAAAGGANPLEVIVRQAEAREQSAPGARVLAVASTLPMAQVIDWAGAVSARPVSVDPRSISPGTPVDAAVVHRCAVAMPWDWRQANAFSEQERLKVAARHMHMAASAGHLSGGASERVIELFEERKPIDEKLWEGVRQQKYAALIQYQMAMQSAGLGGAEPPARLLATARAAEVIECLRDFDTADGCADLLYATRMAGVPLNPAAAVA